MIHNPSGKDRETPIPRDSYDLIDYLDRAYPHRCASFGLWDPRSVTPYNADQIRDAETRYAGARQLIDELVAWKKQELEEAREAAQLDEAEKTETRI